MWNCRAILFASLVLIAAPVPVRAQVLGSNAELSFIPDHGLPEAFVIVKGKDWNAPSEGYCRIVGDPVERYSCKLVCQGGTCEPVGDFTVADVSAGRYWVKVEVVSSYMVPLVLGQWFTVDAETATMTLTTVFGTPVSTVSLRTTYQSSSLAPTPTTTVEHLTATSMMERPAAQEPRGFVFVSIVILLSLVVVALLVHIFRKRKRRMR